MTENLDVTVEKQDLVAVLTTDGYINNQGGERIASVCNDLIEEGYQRLLLDLSGTRIVNSIGISILIEILERLIETEGRLGFCNLTDTIAKTFHIMGLTQFATIYPDRTSALAGLTET